MLPRPKAAAIQRSPAECATCLGRTGSERVEVAAAKPVKAAKPFYEVASEVDEPGRGLGVVFRETEPVFRLPRAFLARPFFDLVAALSIAKSSRFFPALI